MISCTFEKGNPASLRHAVIDLIVTKEDQVLLVKRAPHLSEGGKWGLIGGYVDRNERIPEAAARECLEETGYAIHSLEFLFINDNPNRPNDGERQNISFVFHALADEKIGQPDNESTEQRWFPLSQLPPPDQIAFDHEYHLHTYLKQKESSKATVPRFI